MWDFTTSCTVAPSNLSTSVQGPGKTAEAREKAKCAKYSSIGDSYYFVPISAETFGALGPRTNRFIDELGKQQSSTQESEEPSFTFLTLLDVASKKEMVPLSLDQFQLERSLKIFSIFNQFLLFHTYN